MIAGGFCTALDTGRPFARSLHARLGGRQFQLYRKLWEQSLVVEALESENLLRAGVRGLGFGCGREQLVSLFAAEGIRITATDKPGGGWFGSDLSRLHFPSLVTSEVFNELVTYRPADMNNIPADLVGFDFCWSVCAIDHCGSIRLSKRFIYKQMECLRPGGVAIHTCEYGPKLDWQAPDYGGTIVWSHWDIEEVLAWLRERGHETDFIWDPPLTAEDRVSSDKYHLRTIVRGVESTSCGIVVKKGGA